MSMENREILCIIDVIDQYDHIVTENVLLDLIHGYSQIKWIE